MKTKSLPEMDMVQVWIMGKAHQVPAGLTVMKAMEYAGYRFFRGSGCRAGFCGACGTIYRKENDYKIYPALACQTPVEHGMYLTQLPFIPANRASFELMNIDPEANALLQLYPEVARCVSCNRCSLICPQELLVMDYINAALRGDIQEVARLSFDCIQCGLCAIRCPAEIPQYHVGQLARRIYGKYLSRSNEFLGNRIKEIESGKYDSEIEKVQNLPLDELKQVYSDRNIDLS
ncbi:MAG: 4Fe-4S dicluster domain-containing protein [Candidatus Heimdallarchaeota archaeon]